MPSIKHLKYEVQGVNLTPEIKEAIDRTLHNYEFYRNVMHDSHETALAFLNGGPTLEYARLQIRVDDNGVFIFELRDSNRDMFCAYCGDNVTDGFFTVVHNTGELVCFDCIDDNPDLVSAF